MGRSLPPRQFRILYKSFLAQLVDVDLLPAGADPSRLLVHIAALLGSVGLILAIVILPPYRTATASEIASGAWGHQEFLISTTMAVVGLFTVLAWDSIFPTWRDMMVLSQLPIRAHTIFKAKLAAAATGVAMSLAAVNLAPGIAYPFVIGGVRSFVAYWGVMVAAGLGMFCALVAAQGLTALLLPYRWYLRASNALQVTAFFAILAVYFLTPGPSEMDPAASGGIPPFARALPAFWFLGLFEQWNGSAAQYFAPLAHRGGAALALSGGLAALACASSYYRNMRRIVEEPDVVPANRRRPAAAWMTWAVSRSFAHPLDRAVLLFLARTIARSRQHRNLLAVFGGLALALSLAFAKGMLYGNSSLYLLARRYGFHPPHWYEPNTPMMAAGFILLFLAVIGARATFAVPSALKANWIFRMAAVHSPRAYFAAVRKAMFTLVAGPVWLAAAMFYIAAWGGLEAWGHVLILLAVSIVVVERSLVGFRKMPFACAYLPGESNLRVRLPIYAPLFLFAVDTGTGVERSMFESAARASLLGLVVVAALLQARRRWRAFAGGAFEQVEFESHPPAEVAPLVLHDEGIYGRSYRYLDVIAAPPERPLRSKLLSAAFKTAIATAALCAVGFFYERVASVLHPLPARAGRSVNIGGRSLNYSCLGEGSPTVIFESGRGGPGLIWTPLQQQVARYTRACWYDRAGYGWSDPAPFPHPASAIAADLHLLLRRAGVPPPYVLVGASFGGICVRIYAREYPKSVAGMVLVDSTHIDQRRPIDPPGGGYLPYFPAFAPALAPLLEPFGVVRLSMPRAEITPFEPRTIVESLKEMGYESLLEARAVRTLGDIPLVVMTAGRHRVNPPENPADARRQIVREREWMEAQQQLAELSSRGEQWRYPDAGHNLVRERPQDVLAAIAYVVGRVRPQPQQPE